MMERELDRRRGWSWKNWKNAGVSGGADGGSSPAPVKLFDEQVCVALRLLGLQTEFSRGYAV
jgi:hypothetical protein